MTRFVFISRELDMLDKNYNIHGLRIERPKDEVSLRPQFMSRRLCLVVVHLV